MSVVVDLTEASADPETTLAAISSTVEADGDVLAVGESTVNEAGDTAVVPAIPRTGPASETTGELIHRLRDDIAPEMEAATGAEVLVSGGTAGEIDFSDKLNEALPVFMSLVIGLTRR